jgi:hypothetical protein
MKYLLVFGRSRYLYRDRSVQCSVYCLKVVVSGGEDTFHLRAHNEFLGYFVGQWFENEDIPVVLWSCYHRRRRTNTAVEGWNNKV